MKPKRAKRATRGSSRSQVSPTTLDPHGDDFAYLVAKIAWSEGKTVNAIVRDLGLPKSPLHLMQVKRALKRAQTKFLTFTPPLEVALAEKLAEKVNKSK